MERKRNDTDSYHNNITNITKLRVTRGCIQGRSKEKFSLSRVTNQALIWWRLRSLETYTIPRIHIQLQMTLLRREVLCPVSRVLKNQNSQTSSCGIKIGSIKLPKVELNIWYRSKFFKMTRQRASIFWRKSWRKKELKNLRKTGIWLIGR